jgi:hypothetical protein
MGMNMRLAQAMDNSISIPNGNIDRYELLLA